MKRKLIESVKTAGGLIAEIACAAAIAGIGGVIAFAFAR